MTGGRTVLLVGGPEVGKTNYLMRFWLAVRDNKERTIKPLGLPDDLEYLNRGADALLGGHFAGRTLQRIGALCEIPLTVRDEPFSLLVPDIAGEEWMRIYNDRRWPADWATYFTKDTSFLVFVRAHSPLNVPQLDWQTVQRYFGGNRANLDPNISKGVTPEEAPTQVVIVDWIQTIVGMFRQLAGVSRKPRIGIVVSAWDRLSQSEQEEGPSAYLKQEFRLLADYLESNKRRIETACFGVSVVGGDLNDEPYFRERFLDTMDPLTWGSVWHELEGMPRESHDLALPVAWALDAVGPPGK